MLLDKWLKPDPDKKTIDLEIEHVLRKLETLDPTSQEYITASDNLAVLCKARSAHKESSIKPDTIILAATNILGILLILNHESIGNVVSSKALGLLVKGRM